MKRRQFFEFNEAAWLPAALRALITDYVRTLVGLLEPFSPQLPLIARALNSNGADAGVVDLCSGTGGPWRHLSPQLNRLVGRAVTVRLTDRFPVVDKTTVLAGAPDVAYHPLPVDARAVPPDLNGLRCLFDAFHQFPPDTARAILADAVADNQPIVVVELLRRSPREFVALLFTPALVWLLTPLTRPFSWSRVLLTYLIPLAPALILWDSLVSTLRCYHPGELLELAQTAGGGHYRWHADSYRHRGAPVTFLIGYPEPESATGPV